MIRTGGDTDEHAAISAVLARYAACLDDRDFEGAAHCFTPGARATFSGVAMEPGREAIAAHLRGLDALDASTHLLGLPAIEVDGDTATATTPAVAFLAGDSVVRTRGLRYTDVLQRHDGRWLIAERVHRVDWVYESPAVTRFG